MTVHTVVVGSGIAGLTVALHALDHGCRVTLVTKDVLDHANTRYAQGGIAGVMFADDRVGDHIHDTMVAGAGLSDSDAVRVLVEEGPSRIRELVDIGVAFDRDADGGFVKGLEAAHSYPRILHSGGDATGIAIERALVARLRASDARVIEHAFLVDLGLERGRATGVDLLIGDAAASDSRPAESGRRERIDADAVVLATGGAGQLYAHTTNPPVATGDGIAAALRAGARVADLEFFQFHPTVLGGRSGGAAVPKDGASGAAEGSWSFLVSEAVRGEGATLVDEHGRRFALDAHPAGELAPRDVVARAIARRMEAQDGRPVFLDATRLRETPQETAAFLSRRFPTIDRAVRDRGLDWSVEPIPVTPAAHYLMGGVSTDLHGRTSVPGLYAVGEVARTGVHGANRLASNSLLEGAVFGARAGDAIVADAASGTWPALRARPACPSPREREQSSGRRPPTGEQSPGRRPPTGEQSPFTRAALQELMWQEAGLVRDAAGLGHAASVLARWSAEDRTPRTEADFEDENLLLVARELVDAAIGRTDSVGAHFRSDAPVPSSGIQSARNGAETQGPRRTGSAPDGLNPERASDVTNLPAAGAAAREEAA